MVPQPGHGVPGYIIPRKRVGAGGGGMWILSHGIDVTLPEDPSMCKNTGARDFETPAASYSNLDVMCNNGLESFTTGDVDKKSPLSGGKEPKAFEEEDTEGDLDQMIEVNMKELSPPEDPPEDPYVQDPILLEEYGIEDESLHPNLCMRQDGDVLVGGVENAYDDDELDGEEEETSPAVDVKSVTLPGDEDEPDMGFEEMYSLLERPMDQDSAEISTNTMDDIDITVQGASGEAMDLHEGSVSDGLSLFLSPYNEAATKFVAESPIQGTNEIEFLFLPSSAQEALQSGTGPPVRPTNEQDFLSLSSSAQESSQGASESFFRQSENDSYLLLSSPDEGSWHSTPNKLFNGYEGVTSPTRPNERSFKNPSYEVVASDTFNSMGLSQSVGSSSQIDHERPIQTYGSVLASSTKFPGTIAALEGSSMLCPTSRSTGRFNKAASVPSSYVDLTEDSDEDDVVEFSNSSTHAGVLGKRRPEDIYEIERRKRLATAGSSEPWIENRSRPKSMGSVYAEDWRQPFQKDLKIRHMHSFGVVDPRPLHWDIPPGPSYYPQDSSSLISSFNSNMVGGRNVHFSDRGGSGHGNLSFDVDHKRQSFGQSVTILHSSQGGLLNNHFAVPREEKAGKALKAVLQQTAMVDNNKETTPEPGLLSVQLLKHQRIALNWMEEREAKKGLPYGGILADDQGLGKTISTISLILKARAPLKKAAEASGSPPLESATVDLDDDDDVHTLGGSSVNSSTAGEKNDTNLHLNEGTLEKAMKPGGKKAQEEVKHTGSKGRPAAGTLVVCPTSVLRQWGHELKEKVTQLADLSVLVYHGSNRTKDPEELAKYDVVLTTYSIVSMEVPKQPLPDERDLDKKNPSDFDVPPPFRTSKPKKPKKTTDNGKKGRSNGKGRLVEGENGSVDSGPLARVNWFRVVLDEAQSIKNARTQVARAAWGLRAKRRWCLSGTPIQNAVDDLYSYFRFLRYAPYDGYKTFREKIKDPVTRTPAEGYKALQSLLSAVMLRRTKDTLIDGKPIVNLPERIVTLKQTEFSEEERAFYTNLETESRKQFQDYAEAGTLQSNYVNILWMLLRLRQACDHPLLVKGHKTQGAQKVVMESARALPPEKRVQLLNLLESNRAICPICNDLPDEAVVCICTHIFCRQCISEQLATGDDNCCPIPKCRKALNLSLVFTLASLKSCDVDDGNSTTNSLIVEGTSEDCHNLEETGWKTSSKINAVIDTLSSLPKITVVVENGKVVAEVSKDLEDVKLVDTSNVRLANLQPAFSEIVPSTEVKNLKTDVKVENVPCSSGSREISDTSTEQMLEDNAGVKVEVITTDPVNCKDLVTRVFVQSTEKAIVFSQWTSMLDLLEVSLKQAKFNYRRLDGTMSVLARDRAVAEFKTLPEVTVIIMSLKAASLGLNMVAACHVLLLDVWWNPTTEDQAIDRAHRIGQTRTVRVSRFTVRNTIEDRILALQERKRQIVASAFGDGEAGGQKTTRLSAADLEYLFHI
ncbi:protein Mpsnf1.22 [Marchantia polymorpha subsp. ruderalis]